MRAPLWSPGGEEVRLEHYTSALAEYAPFVALCDALREHREHLLAQLVRSSSDNASAAQLHALRGEIRGINRVLDAPRVEERKHEERQRQTA